MRELGTKTANQRAAPIQARAQVTSESRERTCVPRMGRAYETNTAASALLPMTSVASSSCFASNGVASPGGCSAANACGDRARGVSGVNAGRC